MEIRGVYGGRKKRYIVERAAPACSKECKEKPICMPTLGEVIKEVALKLGKVTVVVLEDLRRQVVQHFFFEATEEEGQDLFVKSF